MKNSIKSNQLTRLKNIIEGDRLPSGEDFNSLVVSDLDKLLRDYFDLKSTPVLTILRDKDCYKITVKADSMRIKTFTSLPKD